ncbi:MAG: class I SAM-dependent methyltransferase [Pseudohongiellaceae bacterium]|nr:class I SAM-dependent methyltransferase [Pseudohongiellaceae bacterium]
MTRLARIKAKWANRTAALPPQQLYAEMENWFQTPIGRSLIDTEQRLIEPVVERIFGYHILQLGSSNLSMLDDSPIRHRLMFTPSRQCNSQLPVADNESLPLLSNSVDAVLVHHALDFTLDSYKLLREATRVLVPGGKLLVVGFNPFSTWRLRKAMSVKVAPPWNARYLSTTRVTDWLRLLDFQIEQVNHGGFLLPFNRPRVLSIANRLERIGKRLSLPTGAVYCIVAAKDSMPITPIRPRWPIISRPAIVRPVGDAAGAARNRKLAKLHVVDGLKKL